MTFGNHLPMLCFAMEKAEDPLTECSIVFVSMMWKGKKWKLNLLSSHKPHTAWPPMKVPRTGWYTVNVNTFQQALGCISTFLSRGHRNMSVHSVTPGGHFISWRSQPSGRWLCFDVSSLLEVKEGRFADCGQEGPHYE